MLKNNPYVKAYLNTINEDVNTNIEYQSVVNCKEMFFDCFKLTHLPDNFTLPDNVENCEEMFKWCKSLTHLPENFHIPINANYKNILCGCNLENNNDLEAYIMADI